MGKTKETANLVSNGFLTPTSGKIGIGTDNPGSLVHTLGSYGTVRVENNNTAQYAASGIELKGPAGNERSTKIIHGNSNAGGTQTYFQIEQYNSSGSYEKTLAQYNYQYDYWTFNTGGSEKLRITSDGQLQATGAADVRLTLGSGGTVGTNDSVHMRADGANLKFMAANGGNTIFETNGTETLRIKSTGEINIKGTQPTIELYEATDTYGWDIFRNSADARLKFRYDDNGTTSIPFTITPTSRVGIGTDNPSQKLQVEGSGSQYIAVTSTDSDNTGVLFGDSGDVDSGFVLYANSDNSLRFGCGGGTERLRIESDGGTIISNAGTFPTPTNETLNIQGEGHNGHGTTNTRSVFNVTGAITSNTNGAGLWIGARTNENTAVIGTRTASGNLAIETYNSGWGERLRITSDGKVGLGIDNPEEILHILGPSQAVNDRDGVMLQHSTANANADTGLPIVWSGHIGTQSNYGLASICGRKENSNSGDAAGYLQFATCNVAGALEEKLRLGSTGHLLGNSGARIVQEVYRAEWAATPDQRIYEMNIDNFTNSGTSCYYYFRINAWVDIGNMASPISYDVWIHKRSATAVDMNVVKLTPWHSKAIQFYHYTADAGTGDKRFVMYFGEDYSGFSIIDYTTSTGRMKSTKGQWSNPLNDSAATSAIAGYTAITVYEYSYT